MVSQSPKIPENGPPPLPAENQVELPPLPNPKKAGPPPKTRTSRYRSMALGAGFLYLGGINENILEPIMVVIPLLLLSWLLSRVEYQKPAWSQTGWMGHLWKKVNIVWENHGGGFYGLTALFYFLSKEFQQMHWDYSELSFNFGALFQYIFVDRFVNLGTQFWQSFLWPLQWVALLGTTTLIGVLLLSFNLYELVRIGARQYTDRLKARSSNPK